MLYIVHLTFREVCTMGVVKIYKAQLETMIEYRNPQRVVKMGMTKNLIDRQG